MQTTKQLRQLISKKQPGGSFLVDWDKYDPVSHTYRTYTLGIKTEEDPEETPDETPITTTEPKEDSDTWDLLMQSLDQIQEEPKQDIDTTNSRQEATYNTWQDFRDEVYNALKAEGYEGEAARAIVAQMGLETGHGKHLSGNYNYGNITAGPYWSGNTVVKKDNQNGKDYTFRSYNTLSEGIKDYIKLAQSLYGITPQDSKDTVYAKLNGANSGKRRWAEGQNYVSSMNNVYNMYWG